MLYGLLNTSGFLNTASYSNFSRVYAEGPFVVTHFQDSTETVFFMHAINELLNLINAFIFMCDETLDGKLAHHNLVNELRNILS